MNTVKYVHGLVSEGMIGNAQVYTSIQRIHYTCQECGEKCSSDVWDKGPHGHDACGLIRNHAFCSECGATAVFHFYEGCIVSLETIGSEADEDGSGNLRWWSSGGVGQFIHDERAGERWNVAEQRRYTYVEWNALVHGPHPKPNDDEIPF